MGGGQIISESGTVEKLNMINVEGGSRCSRDHDAVVER